MLYDFPRYYDVAFSFRDVEAETAVIAAVARRYSAIPTRRVLELGCGPSPHAGAMAKRGWQLIGLDINDAMLAYARTQWQPLSPAPEFIRGDMRSFHLDEPVDLAFVMLGSLYADTVPTLTTHFDSVVSVLRPGGLYLLDGCIQFGDPMQFDGSSFAVERDGIEIESTIRLRRPNPDEDLYEESWTVQVTEGGRSRLFETVERNRALRPKPFLEFIRSRGDFTVVGCFQDWDIERPLQPDDSSVRPLVVLRRN